MSEHKATIAWDRGGGPFDPKSYTRDHQWTFGGGISVEASSAPDFLGNAELVNPEDAFVASLSSCHMLTFLFLAARGGFTVNTYRDNAVGHLERNEDKKFAMTRVELRPEVVFEGGPPSAEQLNDLHHKAHEQCFIANSVTTKVTVTPAG